MKINLLLFSILILASTTVKGQEAFTPYGFLGVKGGSSFSRYYFDPDINQKWAIGQTGGLVFKHIGNPNLGIQLEANYVQRGWSETIDSTKNFTRGLDYIEVPFMTHVIIGKKKTAFNLNLGPSLAYLISSRDSIAVGENVEDFRYYHKEINSPWQLGLALGAGISFTSGFGTLQLEGRFNQSLNDIISKEQDLKYAKNSNFTLTLAYLFHLYGKKKVEEPIPVPKTGN